MTLQPRTGAGQFDTTGATPHEKHRYHSGEAHVARVNAAISRHNGDTCAAEKYEATAASHDRLAASHLATALKT